MEYQVGDKVLIKSLDWYNKNKDEYGHIDCGSRFFFTEMSDWCGKIATIKEIYKTNCYRLEEYDYEWTSEMFEGLVSRIGEGIRSFADGLPSYTKSSSELYEEYIKSLNKETNKIISNAVAGDMLAEKTMLDCILAKGLLIPNGYGIKGENGNVINATRIVLEKVNTLKTKNDNMETETHRGYCTTEEETTNKSKKVAWFSFFDSNFADKVELDLSNRELIQEDGKWFVVKKKKEYPKTYEECCEVLVGRKPNPNEISFNKMELCLVDLDNTQSIDFQNPLLFQLNSLFRLLMCRNAYWKLYGEEMGLGKTWEPDYSNTGEKKFSIWVDFGEIKLGGAFTTTQMVLSFPTAEMRDVFYDNFKKEIEICKELL